MPGSTEYSRFNISVLGANATDDFRNEHNTFGYIVEVDPYDPLSCPKKRTAMGRRANEGAWSSLPKAGRPIAFCIGNDSRNEYVYKYVSEANWNPLDARRGAWPRVTNTWTAAPTTRPSSTPTAPAAGKR